MPKSRLGRLAGTLAALATCTFLFFWGQWALVGSTYFRFLPILVAVWVLAKRLPFGNAALMPARLPGQVGVVFLAFVGLAAGYLSFQAAAGTAAAGDAVELHFPLAGGHYYVSSGGSTNAVNNHIRPFPTDQQFAIDIHKLDALGRASRIPASADNGQHFVFGATVIAPCDGVVLVSKDRVDDNDGHDMSVAPEDGRGNFMDLDCNGVTIALSHLRRGSVLVSAGDKIRTGQPLGAVGNSGFSEEPHLHFQAARANGDGELIGIPMQFEGRQLVRNDTLER